MDRSRYFIQRLRLLRNSPLARTLGSFFLVLFVVQGLVVAWLTFDVWRAEQKASREFKMLMASEQVANIADKLREHRRIVDSWRDKAIDGTAILQFRKSKQVLLNAGQELSRSWKEAELEPERGRRMVSTIGEVCEISSRMFDPSASGESREGAHKQLRTAYEHVYYLGLGEINAIRELINKDKSFATAEGGVASRVDKHEKAGVDPLLVLGLAALASTAFGIYIAFYADKYLSGRIIRLAEMCERLKRAEVLPAPLDQRSEVDSLQETFHQMSLKIADIEKGRKSYIHLLKDLQGASLQRARSNLQELANRQTDPRRQDRFNMLKTGVGGMIHLLESMTEGLQYSADQELNPEFQTMSSTTIIEQALASVQALLDKKKIKVIVSDPAVDVQVDPHLINRLIVNFLSNAVKFSPKEATIELNTRVGSEGTYICEVKDAGPGISDDDQKKLFKPFSQVGQDDEIKRSGTGLGLMICKQIVTAHGGTIGCRSKVLEGSMFWFEVPVKQGMGASPAASSPSATPLGTGRGAEPVLPTAGFSSALSIQKASPTTPQNKRLKNALIAAVVIFSLAQTGVAFYVGSKIADVEKKVQLYLEQQQLVIETERFMGLFLTWRVKARNALQDWSKPQLKVSLQLIDDQKALLDKLSKMAKGEAELQSSFSDCRRRLNFLSKTTKMVLDRFSELSMFALAETVRRADWVGMQIEDQIFYQLRIERSKLEMTYGLADQLRAELIPVILLSGLVNALLILWLSTFVLRLLNRTAELTGKAKDFASGGTPMSTVSANDEFSYLDRNLCDAASSIRNAERQRQQLLSIVNHDLRTPMASVLGGLEIVKAGILGDLPAEDVQIVDQADREMRLHLNQINDLLALEQLEAGSLEPKNEPVVLSEALEDAVDLCRGRWRGKVELEFSVSPEIEDAKITGESELLTRMFKAVIENALQATERVQAAEPVKVTLKREGDKIVASVVDSAGGIAPDLLPQIFDRFRFLNEPITGMGLPLAYRLAKIHSAELSVESTTRGSKVSFIF